MADMGAIQVFQSAHFARTYKKLHTRQQIDVDSAVEVIVRTPDIGDEKKGDLAGVFVYKFKSNNQLAYPRTNWTPSPRQTGHRVHAKLVG